MRPSTILLLACMGAFLAGCDTGTDSAGKHGVVKSGYVGNVCGEYLIRLTSSGRSSGIECGRVAQA